MTISIQHGEASALAAGPIELAAGDEAVPVEFDVCDDGEGGRVDERHDGGAFDGGFERRDDVGATALGAPDHGVDDAVGIGGAGARGGGRVRGVAG